MTPEGKIQAEILRYLKSKRIWHFRANAGVGPSGLPDIIAIYNGYFVGLEVKTPTGRPTELQILMQNSIREAGGYSEIVRSVDEVEEILKEIQRRTNENNPTQLPKTNSG